jgi:hypothetical protein
MLSVLAVAVSLALLMFLAYRGVTVLLLAPLMAVVAVVLSGDGRWLLPLYTDTSWPRSAAMCCSFCPCSCWAHVRRLMADSGRPALAHWIVRTLGKKYAIQTVVLACALLTYGGVSLFVVAFAIYPIARNLFEEAQIPKRLIPATIALGAFTFTMTALPGSPAIQNAMPIPYFGHQCVCGAGAGDSGCGADSGGRPVVAEPTGRRCQGRRRRLWRARRRRRRCGADARATGGRCRTPRPDAVVDGAAAAAAGDRRERAVHLWRVSTHGPGFVAERFPALDPSRLVGLWALVIALIAACTALVLLRLGRWHSLKDTINQGCLASCCRCSTRASEVGLAVR